MNGGLMKNPKATPTRVYYLNRHLRGIRREEKKHFWRFIWDFAEMFGFNFGRFTPWVFGKMIGRKGRRVK